MREMTKDDIALYDLLKNDKSCRNNNYEAVRQFYKKQYNIDLPNIPKDAPSIWTVERNIRLLKQTYPSALTDKEEREIKAEKELEYKEMALDENKPLKQEQGTLGLFGELL